MITFLQDKAVLFMKKKFLNFAINCIKESHPDYDDIKIAEMRSKG